jgi:hypothetical protein
VETFRREHGRPPRVLHIGNIANNAYNNVKALRRCGIDGDVLCYDYYHIMGCPEWEDANCSFNDIDPNRPKWHETDLLGYRRPDWFVQGPLKLCLDYLLAKRSGQLVKSKRLWLELARANGVLPPEVPQPFRERLLLRLYGSRGPRGQRILRTAAEPFVLIVALVRRLIRFALRVYRKLRREALALVMPNMPPVISEPTPPESDGLERVAELVQLFSRHFPARLDRLEANDLLPYLVHYTKWIEVFAHYDVVMAYSTDPVYPLLARKRPYIGYEHGTLRDIPFEVTAVGRITALSYAEADVVLMTNADSIPQARSLQRGSIIYGLHGFDFENMQRRISRTLPADLSRLYGFELGTKTFLQPARHHWRDGFATWLKGNDRVVRAVAALAGSYRGKFKVLFVNWGAEVHLTKALIEELDVVDFFHWIEPVPKLELWSLYRAVDCVIDQFVVPCIGSVSLEAIALGRPLITALDDGAFTEFYGATIPLLNCHVESEIAAAMRAIVDGDESALEAGVRSREWFLRHHSGQVMTDKLLQGLETALTGR